MNHSNVAYSHGQALSRWFESIVQLSAKEFGERYRRSNWSAFFTVFEPIALISFLSITQFAMTGQSPWKSALFHTTGIVPFYLFMHVSQRSRALDITKLPPRVTRFDLIIAQLIAEITAKTFVFVLLLFFYWSVGVSPTTPHDPAICLVATMLTAAYGLGVGFINGNISTFIPSWMYIYAVIARGLMVFSGIMLRPENIPILIRPYVVWNPIFQSVTLFRSGFYENFPVFLLDVDYLLVVTLALLAIGMLLNNFTADWR